jgi:hypothetical protein
MDWVSMTAETKSFAEGLGDTGPADAVEEDSAGDGTRWVPQDDVASATTTPAAAAQRLTE